MIGETLFWGLAFLCMVLVFGNCLRADAAREGEGVWHVGSLVLGILVAVFLLVGMDAVHVPDNFHKDVEKQQGGAEFHVGWSDRVEIREEACGAIINPAGRDRHVVTFRSKERARRLIDAIGEAIRKEGEE